MVATLISSRAVADSETPVAAPAARWPWLVVVALLAQMAVVMLLAGEGDALTYDEPAHLAGAIGNASDRDLDWNYEHPPLVKATVGLVLRLSGVESPAAEGSLPHYDDYVRGVEILDADGNDVDSIARTIRIVMTGFALMTGIGLFLLSRELFGPVAALVPLSLFTFLPDVLGHGRLLTIDLPVAGFILFTLWRLSKLRDTPTVGAAAIAGLWFGAALLTKYSAVFWSPVFLLLVVKQVQASAVNVRPVAVVQVAAAFVGVAAAMIWIGELLIEPALGFSQAVPADGSAALHSAVSWLPLPRPYEMGIRHVLHAADGRTSFLLGSTYDGGRIYYYPLVTAMKLPVATLGLVLAGLWAAARQRRREVDIVVLLPALAIYALAMVSPMNIGLRHVFPAMLLLLVPTGMIAARAGAPGRRVIVGVVVVAALTGLSSYPHHLSFVNGLWGGADSGPDLLADSNLDWGQDLLRLRDELGERPRGDVHLRNYAEYDPALYGLDVRVIDDGDDPANLEGWVVASITWVNLEPERWAPLGDPDERLANSYWAWDRRS